MSLGSLTAAQGFTISGATADDYFGNSVQVISSMEQKHPQPI